MLLQVLFHARVAAESRPRRGRAVRHRRRGRRPGRQAGRPAPARVRAGTERIDTAERQEHRWEELKRAEKQRGSSVRRGAARPAGRRAGRQADQPDGRGRAARRPAARRGRRGERLFADAAQAKLAGDDPEAALRTAARRFADDVRAAERSARDAGLDPHALDAEAWRAHWPTAVKPFAAPCGQPDVRRACGRRARTCCRAAARSPRRRSSRSSRPAGSRGSPP